MANEKLRLIHFGRFFGVPDMSPFCVKPEAYMRMLGLEYEVVRGNPRKSPRGQLPVLRHGSETIAGSTEIIDYLRGWKGSHLDDWLTDEQQVQAYHLIHSVEEYLYFLLLYQRWILPGNFEIMKKTFITGVHPIFAALLARFVRYSARQRTLAQGVGRYKPEEIQALAIEGVQMMSRHLGDKDFFFGEKPCWVDCSMYGFVANLLIPNFPDGVGTEARKVENLVAYEERFRQSYFPDFAAPGMS